jgi:hypothetical protein
MYTDVATGRLGMLPTDMALKTDPGALSLDRLVRGMGGCVGGGMGG